MSSHETLTSGADQALQTLCHAAALQQLSLDEPAMLRVAVQWQRLQAMAGLLQEQALAEGDEPASTFLP